MKFQLQEKHRKILEYVLNKSNWFYAEGGEGYASWGCGYMCNFRLNDPKIGIQNPDRTDQMFMQFLGTLLMNYKYDPNTASVTYYPGIACGGDLSGNIQFRINSPRLEDGQFTLRLCDLQPTLSFYYEPNGHPLCAVIDKDIKPEVERIDVSIDDKTKEILRAAMGHANYSPRIWQAPPQQKNVASSSPQTFNSNSSGSPCGEWF